MKYDNITPRGLLSKQASHLELECGCGRKAAPSASWPMDTGHLTVKLGWRKGWYRCTCGGSGHTLRLIADPLGSTREIEAEWRWKQNGLN